MNPRIAVGDVEIVALTDAEGTFTTFREAFPALTGDQEAQARDSWPELFRGEHWFLPFRCYLVRSAGSLVLVDAGVARQEHFLPGAQARLLDALREEGVETRDVEAVLLTHLHVDHIGWTIENGEPVFERARYLACEDDVDYFLRERGDSRSVVAKVAPLTALESFTRFPAAKDEVEPGIAVIPAPGHTPGHVAFEVRSGGSSLLVLGDTVVHPLQVTTTDAVYDADVDAALASQTRRRLLDHAARHDTPVAAGHLPGSGFGRIAREDGRLAFVPGPG